MKVTLTSTTYLHAIDWWSITEFKIKHSLNSKETNH